MKSIELTAYAVREYDVKYTIVLDETDPIIQEILKDNKITLEEIPSQDFLENRILWDMLMAYPTTDVHIDEDFSPAEERFVEFRFFTSEN